MQHESRIFVLNEPIGPRFSVALATEIGLLESIVLLQMEHWIAHGKHTKNGYKWTRQSVRSLHDQFPFVSKTTIGRVATHLEEMGLIISTNEYNKHGYDKTRWFRLNEQGLSKLSCVRLTHVTPVQIEPTPIQIDTGDNRNLIQNEPDPVQNESTIPNKTLIKEKNSPAYIRETESFESWDIESEKEKGLPIELWFAHFPKKEQPYLSKQMAPKEKKVKIREELIPETSHLFLYRLCYRAETGEETRLLSSRQRGQIASVLGTLRDLGADFTRLHHFENWWLSNWRSRDKESGQYNPPMPQQIVEFWTQAMKSGDKPDKHKLEKVKEFTGNLSEIMKKKRQGGHK